MAEPFTIYKLTILYMLDKAGFPLSNTQISNFFLEKEYTDYFRVQEVIGDLVNADLINFESTHSNTQYTLTAAGKETLGFFKDKITDGIESDVKSFFTDNKLHSCRLLQDNRPQICSTLSGALREHHHHRSDSLSRHKGAGRGHLQQLEESERGCVRIPHGYAASIDYFLVFLTE